MSDSKNKVRCERCCYWDAIASGPFPNSTGYCRIHAPTFNPPSSYHVTSGGWPMTAKSDWCAEGWDWDPPQQVELKP
jgi:hypothetical protein